MGNVIRPLQMVLFEDESSDSDSISQTALYDLAPRFIFQVERKPGSSTLSSVVRYFEFKKEMYLLTISPARIVQKDGTERDELPGAREQLVEDVIRKFAADKLQLGEQNEVVTGFSVYKICKELHKHGHTFSGAEVREALYILNKSNIHITKVVPEGEKKPKPVVSATAFPVLQFKDENDPESQSRVQFNPLLEQAIKSLEFEQVNYQWTMQIKGPLARWVFKRISLMLTNFENGEDFLSIKASDIINSFGQSRKRSREMLAEVSKAIDALKQIGMISDYTKTDIKEGRKKVDIVFALTFSERFLEDRKKARRISAFNQQELQKRVGSKRVRDWVDVDEEEGRKIQLGRRKMIGSSASH